VIKSSSQLFKTLLSRSYSAHVEFHREWRKYYDGSKKPEPQSLKSARQNFFAESEKLFNALDRLDGGFKAGESTSIDGILDFIAVDIPAFRCGYAKEKYLRRLKSLHLNPSQIEFIREIGLSMCSSESYRREFRDLARLLIKLADSSFIENVRELQAASDGIVEFKCRLMLQTILNVRKDLS
jgi:hypothetical protein